MNLFGGDESEELIDDDFDPTDTPEAAVIGPGLLAPQESSLFIGHEDIEKQFLAFWGEKRVPHAVILAGPEGIGKATFAFRLARFLLKNPDKSSEPAGLFGESLPSARPTSLDIPADDNIFKQVASQGHPDLRFVARLFDEQKGKMQTELSVKEIRKIPEFLSMTSSVVGGWRVVIVDDADTMSISSQNAILKILEEPPAQTILILITRSVNALLPTIRSRSRVVTMNSLPLDKFSDLLKRVNPDLTKPDIDTLYGISRGSAGQGIRLLAEGGLEAIGKLMALFEKWPEVDWVEIHKLSDTISRPGQESSLRTLEDILCWITENFVRTGAVGGKLPGILDNDVLTRLQRYYPLADWIEICEKLKAHFRMIEDSSLDRRHAIPGAFTILGKRDAA